MNKVLCVCEAELWPIFRHHSVKRPILTVPPSRECYLRQQHTDRQTGCYKSQRGYFYRAREADRVTLHRLWLRTQPHVHQELRAWEQALSQNRHSHRYPPTHSYSFLFLFPSPHANTRTTQVLPYIWTSCLTFYNSKLLSRAACKPKWNLMYDWV